MNVALIAVQLEIGDRVLASADDYRRHLEAAAADAVRGTEPADARVVVFPELAGHVALLALGPAAARKARTLGAAIAASAVRRPFEVLRSVVTTRLLDPRQALLAAIAPDGDRFWRGVFGPLARKHEAYVVAGSHLRLGPGGDLTNSSLCFGPDGRLLSTTDKVNLLQGFEDRAPRALGVARGDAGRLPIVETGFGRLATVISYDGFHQPDTTLERFVEIAPRLAERGGVAIIANPAANPWPWRGPWPPAAMPTMASVRSPDATREAQWRRDGLPGTMRSAAFARWGITAHLVGQVLDLRFEGASEIHERTATDVVSLARVPTHDRGGHLAVTIATS